MFFKENPPIINDMQMVASLEVRPNDTNNGTNRQDELNAAQLLLSLASNGTHVEAPSDISPRKILKPHPKFRVKVSRLLI